MSERREVAGTTFALIMLAGIYSALISISCDLIRLAQAVERMAQK